MTANTKKRALITGVNGFVGPFLANELLSAGYEVAGSGREAQKNNHPWLANISYHVFDVTDAKIADKVVQEVRPTHVFHLAGIASPALAEKNREATFGVHVEGTRHLLDALCALPTLPRALIVSSGNVYGPPVYQPLDEQHPLGGLGAYSESRIAQEKLVSEYTEKLPLVVARSFNHTGPGQPTDYVFPRIVKGIVEIRRGERDELVMGNPNVRRECLHVADVVRAYRQLLEQEKTGITVNVCRGVPVALKEVIEYCRVLAGLDNVNVAMDPAFAQKREIPEIVGSPALLKSLIAWQPMNTEQIVRDLYEYWDKHISRL